MIPTYVPNLASLIAFRRSRIDTAPPQEAGGPRVPASDEAVAWMDSTMLSMILLLFAVFLAVTAVIVLRQPAAATASS